MLQGACWWGWRRNYSRVDVEVINIERRDVGYGVIWWAAQLDGTA